MLILIALRVTELVVLVVQAKQERLTRTSPRTKAVSFPLSAQSRRTFLTVFVITELARDLLKILEEAKQNVPQPLREMTMYGGGGGGGRSRYGGGGGGGGRYGGGGPQRSGANAYGGGGGGGGRW